MPTYLPVSHHYLECFFNVSGADTCHLLGIHLFELTCAAKWYGLLCWPYSWIVGLNADAEVKAENEPIIGSAGCTF